MTMKLAKILLHCGYCSIGIVLGLLYINPARYEGQAGRAIVDQFAATYCNLHPAQSKADADLQSAMAGLMSRMSIDAGVGLVAREAYLKCAAGLQ